MLCGNPTTFEASKSILVVNEDDDNYLSTSPG